MVKVGEVRVRMSQRLVLVRMSMRFRAFVAAVFVAMMFIVHMATCVFLRHVQMFMPMELAKQDPGRGKHESESGCQAPDNRLAEERDCKHCPNEWRRSEVCR